jgi:hypothetical protein
MSHGRVGPSPGIEQPLRSNQVMSWTSPSNDASVIVINRPSAIV